MLVEALAPHRFIFVLGEMQAQLRIFSMTAKMKTCAAPVTLWQTQSPINYYDFLAMD